MKRLSFIVVTVLITSSPSYAQQAGNNHVGHQGGQVQQRSWTAAPTIMRAPKSAFSRTGVSLSVRNLEAASLSIYPPQKEGLAMPKTVGISGGVAVFKADIGNYHWVEAVKATEGLVRKASTVRYFSNPGPSPIALLNEPKGGLEITPHPLPREHARYRAGEEWEFLVRFNGHPVKDALLRLETGNGSKKAFDVDPNGIARILFPTDFPEQEETQGDGGHNRRQASPFVLRTSFQESGTDYLTAFNYKYSPGGMDGKSLLAGITFTAIGMFMAVPLLRRRKSGKGAKS